MNSQRLVLHDILPRFTCVFVSVWLTPDCAFEYTQKSQLILCECVCVVSTCKCAHGLLSWDFTK